MSLMIEKKKGCAIIRCQRNDRLFNTGKKYDTSISIDVGLITFFQKFFEGDQKRMLAWIIDTVREVDGRQIAENQETGFSRLIQREMLLLIERQSKIIPVRAKKVAQEKTPKPARAKPEAKEVAASPEAKSLDQPAIATEHAA